MISRTYNFYFPNTGDSSSSNYTETYTYDTIGNILSKNGVTYTYGAKPHAVISVGANMTYSYDANGNMITRGSQTLTWDVENRLVSVSGNGTTIAQFFYDGNGNRVKKLVLSEVEGIENGETILYINQYYEKNLATGNVTSSYYLGSRLVATKENEVLRYVHQDHLTGTSLMTDSSGVQIGETMKYLPFGETRAGSVPTDKKFTGQRLDGTGLYYYNARYYDATIGRFISPDSITHSEPLPFGKVIKGLTVYRTTSTLSAVQTRTPARINPQEHNRYSYAINNPLKYNDPDGHQDNWYEALCTLGYSGILQVALVAYVALVIVEVAKPIVEFGTWAWDKIKDAAGAVADFFGFGNNDPGNKPENNNPNNNKIKIDESRTEHIFRDAEGHFKYDTPENRAVLEQVANNPNACNGLSDSTGHYYYSMVNPNGTEIWAIVRNGKIINGGINFLGCIIDP